MTSINKTARVPKGIRAVLFFTLFKNPTYFNIIMDNKYFTSLKNDKILLEDATFEICYYIENGSNMIIFKKER